MKLRSIALATGLLLSAVSASAQTAPRAAPALTAADKRVYPSVTEADLVALVQAEGHTVEARGVFDDPSVRAKSKDGLLFLLIGTDCNKRGVSGCQGIMMQVRYEEDANVTNERIAKANYQYAAIGTWWDAENDTVGITRYVILDDGVTWMNIRHNLRVLLGLQDRARAIVFD